LDFVTKRQVAVTVFNALSDFKPVERAYDIGMTGFTTFSNSTCNRVLNLLAI